MRDGFEDIQRLFTDILYTIQFPACYNGSVMSSPILGCSTEQEEEALINILNEAYDLNDAVIEMEERLANIQNLVTPDRQERSLARLNRGISNQTELQGASGGVVAPDTIREQHRQAYERINASINELVEILGGFLPYQYGLK